MTSAGSGSAPPDVSVLTPRARRLLPVFLVLLLALTVHRYVVDDSHGTVEFHGPTMGTEFLVKLAVPELSRVERAAAIEAVEAQLARVNVLMSTWLQDSELSRFNRQAVDVPFSLSPETLAVLQVSQEVSRLSDGAFDITIGPLVAIWGFGAASRIPQPPAPDELEARRAQVGFRNLDLDVTGQTATKRLAGLELDLSAVAKGYAVDQVARALEALGYEDYLVEVGGEVRVGGHHLDGAPWRVAIERPIEDDRAIFDVLPLVDLAMATSGDYRNFYEANGVRFSHTIDPRTGRPIAHSVGSVSVVHRQAVYADALATALNVLGPVEGYALAEREELAAFFILRSEDGGFRTLESSAFRVLRGAAEP